MDTLNKSFTAPASHLSSLNEIPDEESLFHELRIFQEWKNIQLYFLTHTLHLSFKSGERCRDILERIVDHCIQSWAKIQHVLQRMALGENEMSIATQLNLSVTTIRTHRQRIYDKLNVHSSQEAILRSFEHKLLDWTCWPYSNSTDELKNSGV